MLHHLYIIKHNAMKKLILFVVILITLASCQQRVFVSDNQKTKQATPAQYYSAKTNDVGRILRALKLDPSDIYVSYSAMVNMR